MPLMVLLGFGAQDATFGFGAREGTLPIGPWSPHSQGPALQWLQSFTDPRTATALLIAAASAALYRRLWALLPLIMVVPLVSVGATENLQRFFAGLAGQGAAAYPSSPTTLMVVGLGLLVLAVGVRRWLIVAAGLFVLLGVAGQSVDVRYFTDSLGALLLGTSLVAVAAVILRRLGLRL
jgi:hypothetical protein